MSVLPSSEWVGGGLNNGALLSKAQTEFDVFITGDRNLAFQQRATKYDLAIVILHAGTVQLSETEALMPRTLEILATAQPGMVVDIYP
jgi:hypothetical protein